MSDATTGSGETIAGLTGRIRREALRLGFDRVGVAPVRESDHGEFYRRWIEDGRHGEMRYLARPDAVERRLDPRSAWPELRSAVVVAHNYYPGDDGASSASGAPNPPTGPDDSRPLRAAARAGDRIASGGAPPATAGDPSRGVIARYARGRDYHKVIKKKLLKLLRFVEGEVGRDLPVARAYVDTGPVLERELARRAGIGWFGRNTMLIDPRRGSYFFLGTLLLELDLEHDEPFEADRCGSCHACLDACPTGALLGRDEDGAPVIDATRCISYLTIEQRGPIPRELRPAIGNRIFGCDICQEVCPFNNERFVQITSETDYTQYSMGGRQAKGGSGDLPGTTAPELVRLMDMDEVAWDEYSRGRPIRRAKRAGFLRNVAVALGNRLARAERLPENAVTALVEALEDEESLVRGHAAWALGRVVQGGAAAPAVCRRIREALEARFAVEADARVRGEVEAAFSGHSEET